MVQATGPSLEPTPLADASIRRLHRRALTATNDIYALLDAARERRVLLWSGVDRRSTSRTARVSAVDESSFRLQAENIPSVARQMYFSFSLDGTRYFFACAIRGRNSQGELIAGLPSGVYEAERRDIHRRPMTSNLADAVRVELRSKEGSRSTVARVCDRSYDGLGVSAHQADFFESGEEVLVRFVDGEDAGKTLFGMIRHTSGGLSTNGSVRMGLSVSSTPLSEPIPVESRESILAGGITTRAWRRIVLAGSQAQALPSTLARRVRRARPVSAPEIVEYRNDRGQRLVGILDGSTEAGSTAVLIPPSWGRTKETFLPLARSIIKTFEGSGELVSVLRFDGANRRGESYIEPDARHPGDEYLRFKFSQAVSDIRASAAHLKATLNPRSIVLVTFSLASIEGRRAVSLDAGRLLSGWISVVGMVDLQSGLRSVSGGVDYAYGLLEGVSFGRHELVGVLADMDYTGRDALDHRMVFLEDARRDMASVKVPVTWIHGRHDAWMDLDRVVTLMSSGDSSARRLIEVPTGHELRNSREALETFQLIAREIGRISVGKDLKLGIPDLADVVRRREAERSRLPEPAFRAQSFWRDYVLGRNGDGGIRLLTATDAYRSLMETQVRLLGLRSGDRVLDLGSGTGELAQAVSRSGSVTRISVVEVDIVSEALRRSRSQNNNDRVIKLASVQSDLDIRERSLPFSTCSADRVLASLLLSYLRSPQNVLAEARRILRPGGVLVVSSLKRDADISRIYATGIAELQADRVLEVFGEEVAGRFAVLQREFLNSASRLLDLEESGRFCFYDEEELRALLKSAGFVNISTEAAFGEPPQAFVAVARRPE